MLLIPEEETFYLKLRRDRVRKYFVCCYSGKSTKQSGDVNLGLIISPTVTTPKK